MRVHGWYGLLAAVLAASMPVWGQNTAPAPDPLKVFHAPEPLPSFDVATIKPGSGGGAPVPIGGSGRARAVGGGQTILRYIQNAYGIPISAEMRVLGGPAWLHSDPYMIQSKAPDDMRDAMEKMTQVERVNLNRSLQQSLLLDRFKLKVHFETRELPVWELVAAKGGLKIKQAVDPALDAAPGRPISPIGFQFNSQGQIAETTANATSVGMLLNTLANVADVAGRPIIDKAGFTGNFDVVKLTWTPNSPDNASTSLFTALQETLGMKLVPSKAQVEVVVIDSIERPTEN